ncbi:hypothetical protein E2C01_046731 [Portunus trituberculatus]|uniref:Uncharacterized protein n=1 Tax=Portunus trituberculatus TaxID=210409 RepID=A0A5B7G1R4_PORTR|nr:hypothetical protein [Portunus trituberculatus]
MSETTNTVSPVACKISWRKAERVCVALNFPPTQTPLLDSFKRRWRD